MELNNNSRLLIISQNFPPELTASSVLVNNIFAFYKDNMQAIAGFVFGKKAESFNAPCKTYYLVPPDNYYLKRLYYKFTPLFRSYNKFLMKRLVKKINPSVIFGNYPEIEFFIDSYEIARELNIPFYAYMHDLWEENMHKKKSLEIAQKWEKEILLNSTRVFCCTENQQDYYFKKYGIKCDLLLHPVPDSDLDRLSINTESINNGEIAFVGSLSAAMNQDALMKFSHAIASMDSHYKLVWYPIQDIPMERLQKLGFDTSRIEIRVVNTNEMRQALRSAEYLLAPLSFENCSHLEVQTVFSNKLLTYFISGRPILVFSPENSYHAQSAKQYNWGFVIDKDDKEYVKQKLSWLTEHKTFQVEIIEGAIKEAHRRKSSSVASELNSFVIKDSIS